MRSARRDQLTNLFETQPGRTAPAAVREFEARASGLLLVRHFPDTRHLIRRPLRHPGRDFFHRPVNGTAPALEHFDFAARAPRFAEPGARSFGRPQSKPVTEDFILSSPGRLEDAAQVREQLLTASRILSDRAGGELSVARCEETRGFLMRAEQTTTPNRPAPVVFEPNEFYEKMLRQRDADRRRYELSYSQATRCAAEAYERARARHAGG